MGQEVLWRPFCSGIQLNTVTVSIKWELIYLLRLSTATSRKEQGQLRLTIWPTSVHLNKAFFYGILLAVYCAASVPRCPLSWKSLPLFWGIIWGRVGESGVINPCDVIYLCWKELTLCCSSNANLLMFCRHNVPTRAISNYMNLFASKLELAKS